MSRKKEQAKPYYSVAHEYADSLKAFQEAAMMLYTQVNTSLQLLGSRPERAKELLEMLREPAEKYRLAVHGE